MRHHSPRASHKPSHNLPLTLFTTLTLTLMTMCAEKPENELKTGTWRGILTMQDHQLPFNMELVRDSLGGYDALILNAGERLLLDEVTVTADSVTFSMHIFDAFIKAAIHGDSLTGYFEKPYAENYRLPFTAFYNQDWRFAKTDSTLSTPSFSGKYTITFFDERDTVSAIGMIEQTGNYVEGSILTSSTDYRFLEGNVIGGKMYLSTFDGNFTYLLTAEHVGDAILIGDYWSGKTLHRKWIATLDPSATLPASADTLTRLRDGYSTIEFSFPDENGNVVSLSDEKFRNKVVIVQIMGSWCPNCMDETKFLVDWYAENHERGVELVGLAFERKPDFAYASARIKKMKEKLKIPYDILIAGTYDETASESLPMLTGIKAYPTTIFVGKNGQVARIHTGFAGPGTGMYYEEFVSDFNATIDNLIQD